MANALAYGFTSFKHLTAKRVTEVGAGKIYAAIQQSAQFHSQQMAATLALLATPTTLYSERYYLLGDQELQPITNDGDPRPTRGGTYYDVAYPLRGGATAYGFDRISEVKATIEEVNEKTVGALVADAKWMMRHALAALLNSTSYTFADDEHGSLTVQGLANGDSTTYLRIDGTSATDDHYLYQAAGIADATNPFDDIYEELVEHPGNGDRVVVYVPSNLKATIEALATFVEVSDADIELATSADRLRTDGASLIGPGRRMLGKTNNCWVVEWPKLPSNYMLAVAIDGTPPLAMRQHEEAELQGLITENANPEVALRKTNFLRFAGFGVRNRVGALVYRVGTGSWAIPTGYAQPIAV